MTKRISQLLLAAAAFIAAGATQALAHPHVYVTMKSEIVYGADGTVTAVRHAWAFDDMFSTYALQGVESKKKGEYTREELKPLAEVNVTSLKEYNYFTQGQGDGKTFEFSEATDYWLEFSDSVLTLHFTLPVKVPAKAKAVNVEIYDPSYFIDFSFDDRNKDAVKLAGTPGACKLDVSKPGDSTPQGKRLSESFFANPSPNSSNYGAQYANKIAIKCP
jgi:ABC-type uncharacterized transport system substrate-binding protein